MPPSFSDFARTVTVEGAFGVLAVARQLKAQGKRVIELDDGEVVRDQSRGVYGYQ